jgi:epoxide hydrolase 4
VTIVLAAAIGVAAMAGLSGPPDPPALSHEYADVNGVRLHYARAGKGPLVVFLHGFPEFWYEWKDQLAEFATDHTVVAPDMRGYNLSSKPEALSDYAIPKLVEDVRALASELLKSTGGPTFTLVAHDWGGAIAWVFAAQHPEMLDRLVIVNAPHPTVFSRLLRQDAAQQKASGYMLMFRSPGAEAALSANSYSVLTSMVLGGGIAGGSITDDDKEMYLAAWSRPNALTGGLNYYRASGIGPVTTTSGTPAPPPETPPIMIRVPTLVIWGEKDTALLPQNLDGLDAYVPHLTIERIADGTHWVVRENAREVNRLIREYLGPR